MVNGRLFVISAPSGTGKTTLLKQAMSEVARLKFSVSHTTRAPRQGEVDGKDYHFVSEEDFLRLRDNDGFLESAHVHQNYYGTSRSAVADLLEQGVDVVLDIDVQGATILMENGELAATYIFIAPPDMKELERRLRSRGSDSDEAIQVRLDNAIAELSAADKYEYLIVNNDLQDAATLLCSIIRAERSKARRNGDGSPAEIKM